MKRMIRVLAGFALAVGMFASVGNTAMAKTYTLSEILAEVHQDERYTDLFYSFEGAEEMNSPAFYPPLGAGPYFAPGDRIVSDIPGVYLLTSNPEMDNIKKVRGIIAEGWGTYNKMDGSVGNTIGEGAPVLTSVYSSPGGELYDTYTEGSKHGLFQSLHFVSNEDEEAVYLLSNATGKIRGEKEKGLAKSYRGWYIDVYYAEDGTLIAYYLNFKPSYDREPNTEQYYAEKAALRNAGQVQEQAPAEKGSFDAGYYAANNPDVVAVLGTDAEALWQHYVTAGWVEGRKAHP